jgi:2'-5' RNA ligase superfamily
MAAPLPGAPAVGAGAAHGDQTALLMLAPAAEPAVAESRARLDPAAGDGVPAHLTVLYPFLRPALIDGAALTTLRRLFADFPAFTFALDQVGWFGDTVAWLGPRDERPFRALTARAFAAFPSCPPYGGEHADPVPHLTFGNVSDQGDLPALRAAAQAVVPCLPVEGTAIEVTLMGGPPPGAELPASGPRRASPSGSVAPLTRWRTLAAFPLGPPGHH